MTLARLLPLLMVAPLLAAMPRPAVAQAGLAGDWAGTYVCAQGSTGLNLRLSPVAEGGVAGVFHFHPLASNPRAAEGCYEVSAPRPAKGEAVTIAAGRWLMRPDHYVTVDLVAELDEDGTLYGHVEGPGCGLFAARRASLPRPLPAACGAVVSSR